MMLVTTGAVLSVLMLGGTFVWFVQELRGSKRSVYGRIDLGKDDKGAPDDVTERATIEALLERADAVAQKSRALAEQAIQNIDWGKEEIVLRFPTGTSLEQIEFLFLSAMTAPTRLSRASAKKPSQVAAPKS